MTNFQMNVPSTPIDSITNVREEPVPTQTQPAGYAALIGAFGLEVPLPDELVAIGEQHSYRRAGRWRILTPRYQPAQTVAGHLAFALRHEGVDLAVLSALFAAAGPEPVAQWVHAEPTGGYARRAWFLYEWITGQRLDLADAAAGSYVGVLDPKRQYATAGVTVTRHRVRNNLPGTSDFCPLVRRTERLHELMGTDLASEARAVIGRTAPDLVARAAAFLLLADSKASYVIEGERPPQERIQRWGQAIGEAGRRALTEGELLRLQRLVIGDARFTHLGWRTEGGFVGRRDRESNAPLPDHISARADDLAGLIKGVIAYAARAEAGNGGIDPIVAAAVVAFGFVFIHPFEDGNGRIHRWLVHHVLARCGFNPPGIVFPVSSVFLNRIETYRAVLEHYSRPRLELTHWETTPQLNVRVLNATRDHFRFFDATAQAEFLAACVLETVRVILPGEIDYLRRYDQAKQRIGAFVAMPDATFDLMMGFLRQNGGEFSKRAREREFSGLTDQEALAIEGVYRELLMPEM